MLKKYAKIVDENDNVATCVAEVESGEIICIKFGDKEEIVTAKESINFGHKIAIKDIHTGEYVLKYGQAIGIATRDIKIGDWVHTHNVVDHYEVR
jgi:altronate dehydratase small subunit